MHGPELELHVDPTVKPHVCHTPAPVPAHWEAKVKADLQRDVDLGVLEKVGPNVPVTWCARMVIQRKHNGDPRRTIDFQKLNEACKRQTHHTAPPLQQAHTIPHNTLKSTNDAWNGFHSLKVKEEDRHYFTFITPYGRYRCKTAPMGWLATGDGYTLRYDNITRNVENKRQAVDDALLYSNNVKEAFQQNAEYFTLVGRNGIILRLASRSLSWLTLRVSQLGGVAGPATVSLGVTSLMLCAQRVESRMTSAI